MILESDRQRLDALANDIVNLDQRIFSCTIVSNPQDQRSQERCDQNSSKF